MISQAVCGSFKQELLNGVHDFGVAGHTFKLALYTTAAVLDANTTAYTTTAEVSDPLGYSAGGSNLTVTQNLSGTTAYIDFSNLTFTTGGSTNLTFSTRGALIYNSSVSDKAVVVLDFGLNYDATGASTLTITFPSGDATSAIVRIN